MYHTVLEPRQLGSPDRGRLAHAWRLVVRLQRVDIFGPDDALQPVSNPQDIDTLTVGYVVPFYLKGGAIILSINPAGGADHRVADAADHEIYRMFRAIGTAGDENVVDCFEAANLQIESEMPK